MTALKPRERRLLILALLVAIGTLGYAFVVAPLMDRHHQVGELITARRAVLARQQQLLARKERYAEEHETLTAEITRRRARLLPGSKPPLAASELQKLVKGIAQDTGVEVRSERVLPTTERGGYVEVPVEVTLAGPIRALVSLMYRLESAPVLIGINDLKIRVTSVSAPRELSATLSLSGYIAATPPTAPAAPPPSLDRPAGRSGA